MTAVDVTRLLIIERNDASGPTAATPPFKRVFLVDLAGAGAGSVLAKREVLDLMRVADPDDLNRDGSTRFTFPFVTVESVLVLGPETLLIVNDNNYPGGGGRGPTSDNTEFLLIRLPAPL
jgi:hypothetical protein